ncbi:MAG: hypothetical protein IKC03_11455 [Oscillospiraceae bacterium]|nr:hypothetical protein [Oscillospiraceae bacterium]
MAMKHKLITAYCAVSGTVKNRMADRTGDISTESLGSIIFGVVLVGILLTAVNKLFPGITENLMNMVQGKLDKLWQQW